MMHRPPNSLSDATRPQPQLWRAWLSRLATALLAGALAVAFSTTLFVLSAHAQAVPPSLMPARSPAPQDLLPRAAASVGVSTCLPALRRMAPAISASARNQDLLLDWDRAQPDRGPFFSLVGVEYADRTAATLVTTVPDARGGCSFAAERITSVATNCRTVAKTELASMKRTQLLPSMTVFSDPADSTATVVLIDAAPGCLVIRRQVQWSWRETPGATP